MKHYILYVFLILSLQAYSQPDIIPPKISLIGPDTILVDVFSVFNDRGVILSDNVDDSASLKQRLIITNDVNLAKLGVYHFQYNLTDKAGNPAKTTIRTIKVVDRIAPEIHLKGDQFVTMCRYAKYVDNGYTVTDNYDSILLITKEGNFLNNNGLLEGLYNLRYKAIDKSGNIGYSEWRYIVVRSLQDCGGEPQDTTKKSNEIEPKYFESQIYPNPVIDYLHIESQCPNFTFQLYNLTGEMLLKSSTNVIYIASIPNGIYIAKVVDTKSITVKKLEISHY